MDRLKEITETPFIPATFQEIVEAMNEEKELKNPEGELVHIEKIKDGKARVTKRENGKEYHGWCPLEYLSVP